MNSLELTEAQIHEMSAVLHSEYYILSCFTSHRATQADVDMVMDTLAAQRKRLQQCR